MKGSIAVCLQNLVETKFGKDKWANILEKSGLQKDLKIYTHHEIEDTTILNVVSKTCEELGITLEQAADAFGNHWMTEFAPKHYYAFILRHSNAKDFLLHMDKVHGEVTTKENSTPPRFNYEIISDNTITMEYKSKRGMELFWIGLIKGVGAYYKENIEIKKTGNSKVELTFAEK